MCGLHEKQNKVVEEWSI